MSFLKEREETSWYLWPFITVWRLMASLVGLVVFILFVLVIIVMIIATEFAFFLIGIIKKENLRERTFKFEEPEEYLSEEAEKVGKSILKLEIKLENNEVGLPVQGKQEYSELVKWVKEDGSFKTLTRKWLREEDPVKKQLLKFQKHLKMLETWADYYQYFSLLATESESRRISIRKLPLL